MIRLVLVICPSLDLRKKITSAEGTQGGGACASSMQRGDGCLAEDHRLALAGERWQTASIRCLLGAQGAFRKRRLVDLYDGPERAIGRFSDTPQQFCVEYRMDGLFGSGFTDDLIGATKRARRACPENICQPRCWCRSSAPSPSMKRWHWIRTELVPRHSDFDVLSLGSE